MAAVKAQRGGPRKEPVFKPSLCSSCGGALDTLKQAWRVKSLSTSSAPSGTAATAGTTGPA